MRRTLAVLTLTAAILTTAGCGKSYDDYANECADALAHHVKGKPEACEHISQDDYTTLRLAQALTDSGIVDDDGNVDMGKLLDGATEEP